jgi:hypothetical protein
MKDAGRPVEQSMGALGNRFSMVRTGLGALGSVEQAAGALQKTALDQEANRCGVGVATGHEKDVGKSAQSPQSAPQSAPQSEGARIYVVLVVARAR